MSQRVLAQAASEYLGRPVIVIGKPGAGGIVAARYVIASKPDGYRLFLFNSGTNGIVVAVRKVPFKNSDFDVICGAYIQNLILMVPANSRFKKLEDVVAYAKKHPGKLKYATTGVGTSSHLAAELFNQLAGIKTVHVPFQGGPKTYAAIVGGHVDFSIFYYGSVKGLIDAGKLRMLAVANPKRASNLPNLPTFAEKGYPKMVFNVWYGVAAPKGLPANVLAKLQMAFGKAARDKTVAKMLHKLGYTEYYQPRKQFLAFVAREVAKFKRIVREANIKIR
ncbi:MAG: tripartite tricarboxylate transporter substrate binding protein [Proteobacteria bacterium]|nr:tripartite tricarboxylate transporter substrate binding protein [Pseudomonadota bacterium]MBU1740075.1 tripartite tricarboxylate transporter substrate binding protein [Pseudomonadota bacterium]